MSFQGYLVKVDGVSHVVTPSANPFTLNGSTCFWFYHNGVSTLAERKADASFFTASLKTAARRRKVN